MFFPIEVIEDCRLIFNLQSQRFAAGSASRFYAGSCTCAYAAGLVYVENPYSSEARGLGLCPGRVEVSSICFLGGESETERLPNDMPTLGARLSQLGGSSAGQESPTRTATSRLGMRLQMETGTLCGRVCPSNWTLPPACDLALDTNRLAPHGRQDA